MTQTRNARRQRDRLSGDVRIESSLLAERHGQTEDLTGNAGVRKATKIGMEHFERLLMKAPSASWQLFIALAWHCGLRHNEALAVRGEDVDLKAGEILIRHNKARDESQTVIVTPDLEAMLREQFPHGLPDGPLVNGLPSIEQEVSRAFAVIARRATVPGTSKSGWCTLHDLRRSYGSRWASNVPAQVLRSLMRHSSLEVTLTFYADVKDAANAAVRGAAEAAPNAAPNNEPLSLPA